MLVYLLAIASGSGSLALFLTAFFLPEIHKKGDFLWSGLGLFYALVLWVTAAKIGGGLLLGETAGVAVLIWAILQMLQTRWKLIPLEQRSAPSIELMAKIEKLLSEETLQKIQVQLVELANKVNLPAINKSVNPVSPPKTEVGTVVMDETSTANPPSGSVEVSKTEVASVAVIPEPVAETPAPQTPKANPEDSISSPDTTTQHPPEITKNPDDNT